MTKYCKNCPEVNPDYEGVLMGCLPGPYEIQKAVRQDNAFWECHTRPGVVCGCAVNEANRAGLAVPSAPTFGESFGGIPSSWNENNQSDIS